MNKAATPRKRKVIVDGFGNTWQCVHDLNESRCFLQIVRPGKCQCICDAGISDLIDAIVARELAEAKRELRKFDDEIRDLTTALLNERQASEQRLAEAVRILGLIHSYPDIQYAIGSELFHLIDAILASQSEQSEKGKP